MTAGKKAGTGDESKEPASQKKKREDELDEALDESFPASDPPSMTQPPHSKEDKDEI